MSPNLHTPATGGRANRNADTERQINDSQGETLRYVLTPADVVGPFDPPRWLWKDRIPLGELSDLAGRGEVAKTAIVIDLIAQLSRGELAGDLTRKGRTIYFSDEASFERVISPRYAAARGEPNSLFSMTIVDSETASGTMTTRPLGLRPRDMATLTRAVADEGIDLIVIDPIDMLLGGIDTHRNNEVRAALRLIQSSGCTVIGIQHFAKGSSGGHAGDQVMGSAAFRNFPRSVLLVAKHRDRPGEILVSHNKSNYGPCQPTLSLRIVDSDIPGYPRVEWLGEDPTSADQLFQSRRGPTRVEECSTWLEQLLIELGPTLGEKVLQLADASDYGRTTVYEARKRIGVTTANGLWTL